MPKRLLFKLTTLVLVVTLLAMGVTLFFVTRVARQALYDRLYADLGSDAQLVKFWLDEWLPTGSDDLNQQVKTLGDKIGRRLTVIDLSGEVLADSEAVVSEIDLQRRPEVTTALDGELGFSTRISETTGEKLVYAAIALDFGGAARVALSAREIDDAVQQIYFVAVGIAFLVGLFSFFIVYLVNRNMSGALTDLLQFTKRLQKGEFGRRVLVRSHDEIGALGMAFNDLSKTLEMMFDTIRDRERKLNTILSSMDDGVLAVNLERRIILANRAIAQLTGMDEEQLIGKDQMEVIRNIELVEILKETSENECFVEREIRLYPGGHRILAVSSNRLEGEDGTTIGAVAVLRDVTSLRRLERVRKEFVANVSHELRTPLTSIKGFVMTLLNGKLDDRELVERFLTIVNQETDRMIGLINDLLDLSRIESGTQLLAFEPVNVYRLFEDTITMLQAKAADAQVTLENNVDPELNVLGDEKLLRLVATNLLDNSIKYNRPQGKSWVTAKCEGDEVEVTVADTGVGIPEEHLDRVFERFYRVDKGRSRKMGGTGLGLSIVRHTIERHKGMITAFSQPGRGTQIRFRLKKG